MKTCEISGEREIPIIHFSGHGMHTRERVMIRSVRDVALAGLSSTRIKPAGFGDEGMLD
jgi:hypothetical protein